MRRLVQNRLPVVLLLLAIALLPLTLTGRLAAQTIPGPEPPQETTVPTPGTPVPISTSQPVGQGVGDFDITFDVITASDSPTEAQVTIFLSTLNNLTDCNGLDVVPDRVEITPLEPASAPPLPGDLMGLGDVFRVQIFNKENQVVCGPNLTPPAIVCVVPTAEQIAAVGGIENVQLFTREELIGGWLPLATRVIGGNRVCASVTSFSLFRPVAPLVVQNLPRTVPQPTAAPIPRALPDTGAAPISWVDYLLPLLIGILLVSGLWWSRPQSD